MMQDYEVANNFDQLKAMRDLMYSCNNEDYITDWWVDSYPDGAFDDDLLEIASDPERFGDIAKTFIRIIADIYERNDLGNLTFVHGKIDEDRGGKITEKEKSAILDAAHGCMSIPAYLEFVNIMSKVNT